MIQHAIGSMSCLAWWLWWLILLNEVVIDRLQDGGGLAYIGVCVWKQAAWRPRPRLKVQFYKSKWHLLRRLSVLPSAFCLFFPLKRKILSELRRPNSYSTSGCLQLDLSATLRETVGRENRRIGPQIARITH
jgi:hypothetical protein